MLLALHLIRGARYPDLSDATHRRKIAELENAKTSITLEQFDALAESPSLDAIALMALCVSLREGVVPRERILDSITKLTDCEAAGGMELIREQSTPLDLWSRDPAVDRSIPRVKRLCLHLRLKVYLLSRLLPG